MTRTTDSPAKSPRQQVQSDYDVIDGIIRSPGKFEGQALYVPHFWDMGLEGFADRDDGRIYTFKLTKEDKAMWPELPKRRTTLRLREDSQGFVVEVCR